MIKTLVISWIVLSVIFAYMWRNLMEMNGGWGDDDTDDRQV